MAVPERPAQGRYVWRTLSARAGIATAARVVVVAPARVTMRVEKCMLMVVVLVELGLLTEV